MHRSAVFFAIALVVACHNTPPEGVYPCRQATVAHDCPELWYCRRDNLCWITDDPDAGVTGGDAGMPVVDAGPDAARDTGPHCTSETCNGMDDDCDGLIDEGVMTVGPAVTLTTQQLVVGAIVPTSRGFGIGELSFDPSPGSIWRSIDASGASVAGPSLDASVASRTVTDAADVGASTLVVVAATAAAQAAVFGFDGTTGSATLGATPFVLPLEAGRRGGSGMFSQASATRATLYVGHSPTSGSGPSALRRYRLDLSGTPRILDARDVALDVIGAVAVLGTDMVDYVVYGRSDNRIALIAVSAGDGAATFHVVGTIGDATSPAMDYAALAIRDRSADVSPSNPLGIAWEGRNTGNPPRTTLAFVEATNTTVLSTSTPITFPDAYGAWGGFYTWATVALVALSDGPEHWVLVSQDTDTAATPTGGLVQVREIVGAGTNVRRLTVPSEALGPQNNIAVALSANHIRLVEASESSGLITRSIGCE